MKYSNSTIINLLLKSVIGIAIIYTTLTCILEFMGITYSGFNAIGNSIALIAGLVASYNVKLVSLSVIVDSALNRLATIYRGFATIIAISEESIVDEKLEYGLKAIYTLSHLNLKITTDAMNDWSSTLPSHTKSHDTYIEEQSLEADFYKRVHRPLTSRGSISSEYGVLQ